MKAGSAAAAAGGRDLSRYHPNAARLIEIMAEDGISRAAVAALVRASDYTVASWLRPVTSEAHRAMPDASLELLCMKLGISTPRLAGDVQSETSGRVRRAKRPK